AVIVDNDSKQTALSIVESFKKQSFYKIEYYVEPEQNIALARNKAVENAKGNYIAFIDDDEFPTNTWLLNLYKAYNNYNADGILGPVKPHFDEEPPSWLIKGKFCERPSYNTGTVLHWDDTRTGNVLFNRDIFMDENNRFGPEFGKTGGEDVQFFEKMIKEGRVFVWCADAPVYETVLPARLKKTFYLKKDLRIGGLTGEQARGWPNRYKYLTKITLALAFYSVCLPFSFFFGAHAYMKYLTKFLYYAGCILGFCGWVIIR
ncbi:unnamed protein product, partial [marine sediment metagenome]